MKAANIEAVAPRSVVLKTTTLDETLAADAIMIRSHYSLTNTGTELARFTGLEAEFSKQFKYPFVMGWANVGTVMRVGGAVADIAEGSVVLSFGPHASVFKTGRNRIMGKVPDGLDPAVAIFARMGAVSITALRKADLSAGDKVLVIGQGIVGHLAAQLFRIAGADVMVTDVIESRLHAAREAGIVDVVNPSTTCLEDAVAAWTGGKGPRIVVEAVGSAELICTAVRLAARHGQVILLGTPRRQTTLEVTSVFARIHTDDVTVKGAYLYDFPWEETDSARHSIVGNVAQMLRWIQEGRVNTRALLTRTFQPQQCQEAYDTLEREKDRCHAILFDWRQVR